MPDDLTWPYWLGLLLLFVVGTGIWEGLKAIARRLYRWRKYGTQRSVFDRRRDN